MHKYRGEFTLLTHSDLACCTLDALRHTQILTITETNCSLAPWDGLFWGACHEMHTLLTSLLYTAQWTFELHPTRARTHTELGLLIACFSSTMSQRILKWSNLELQRPKITLLKWHQPDSLKAGWSSLEELTQSPLFPLWPHVHYPNLCLWWTKKKKEKKKAFSDT